MPEVMQIRQNYDPECEAGVNRMINLELHAYYVYQQMAFYTNRWDVALQGFQKFFKETSDKKLQHAETFMRYQNMRGGSILLEDISKPSNLDRSSALKLIEKSLKLEKTVNKELLSLHALATKHTDPQLSSFLETTFLGVQVKFINTLGYFLTELTRVGNGLGLYEFDKQILDSANKRQTRTLN